MKPTKNISDLLNKKLIIFDLDGTLIDSKQDIILAVEHAARAVQHEIPPRDVVEAYISSGSMSLIKEVLGDNARFEEAFAVFTSYYHEHMLDHTRPYEHVVDLMDLLRDKTLTIMSNKRERFCRLVIERLGWSERFKMIVGGDTRPHKKPHPDPLVYILKETGFAPAEALMVGDSPQDLQAAEAAGIESVAVLGGFTAPDLLRKTPASLYVDSISALLVLMKKSFADQVIK